MNLFIRLIILTFRFAWCKKQNPFDPVKQRFTVLPNDLDTNLHMNNGRYLTIMDLGRYTMMLKTGLLRHMLKEKWQPIVGSALLTYRKGLNPFDRYTLTTHIRHWDERWFFMEQCFMRGDTLIATGYIKGCLYSPREKRIMNVAEVVEKMGATLPHPTDMPDFITNWLAAEDEMYLEAVQDAAT